MAISIAMLVKHPNIAQLSTLVEYMREVCNDYVIVDTGSTPAVVNRMRNWQDVRVLPRKWRDDFAWARNEGLSRVKNTWTLVLDPDELPSYTAMNFLHEINLTSSEVPQAYEMWWVNFWDGVEAPAQEMYWHARLFTSGHWEFYRPVHEMLAPKGGLRGHQVRRAPQSAYIIHSKTAKEIEASDKIHARIGFISR